MVTSQRTDNWRSEHSFSPFNGAWLAIKILHFITGIPLFIVLCRYFVFHKLKVCKPCVKQVYQYRFSNSICSLCFSGSHFGNSHNISHFFIIIKFVISDLWCYYCNWFGIFLAIKYFLFKGGTLFFRYNAIAQLLKYSVNITSICAGKPK